ncbi:MAG TPA: ABC transporter ATP-binding protein [Candidatus Saccharimonadales bacterium]|nr:ABC transporter ATP-binding protein [Candidatus Saccharimonadales bacterium]
MTTSKTTLKIYWQYTRPYAAMFWFATIGSVMGVLLQDIIPPFLVSRTFSKLQIAYGAHKALQFSELEPYVIGFIASMFGGLVFWRLQGLAVWRFETNAQRNMIVAIFDHLQHQGRRFHANRFGGALVSQTTKFIGSYERICDEFIWSIIPSLTALIASTAILFAVEYKFAIILLIVVAIYVCIMSWRVRHQFPFNKDLAEHESQRTAALADAITNIGNINAFAHEDYELKRFAAKADATKQSYHRLEIEAFKNDSISHSMTVGLRILGYVFGVYAILSLHANASILYLAVAYAGTVVDRLWLFGRIARNLNRSFGDAVEMTEILQIKPEIADPVRPEKVKVHRGSIQFVHVDFRHEGANTNLFTNLNLRIKQGEKVGLVGSSGGGKTTLTNLLMRFMDIDGGEILIDNQNIAKIRQQDLRKLISYVPQEPLLFHRSLHENIRYGQLDADDQAIVGVAKMAHADEFIDDLPKGYETLVGERGVKLSGGQRQRIAIARAMLKNAPILVLDEATSALDSESEVLIQDALWKLMENRTAIVIAHRLSTVQKMDRIIVLDNGEIAEEGSHKELLSKNGVYAKLWAHQSGGFIEDQD